MTDLLKEIEQYLGATGMKPAAFGRDAMGDPNFVFEMRNGRDYRRTTAERVAKFIATHPSRTSDAKTGPGSHQPNPSETNQSETSHDKSQDSDAA